MIKVVCNAWLAMFCLITAVGCAINSAVAPGYTPSMSPQQIQQVLSSGKVIPLQLREKIIRLYDPDPLERARAAYQLGKMERSAAPAIPYLVELLADASSVQFSRYLGGGYHSSFDTTPADEASRALASIGEAANPALIEAARSDDMNRRRHAATALGQIGELASITQLVKLLHDEQEPVRSAAATALGQYRHPRASQILMDVIPGANASARTAMIYALAQINDILSVPFLLQRLPNEETEVRAAILYALGELHDARALDALLDSLSNQDATLRVSAVQALGNYHSPAVIEALLNMLDDEAMQVRQATLDALFTLTGKNYGQNKAQWQQWWQEQKQAIKK